MRNRADVIIKITVCIFLSAMIFSFPVQAEEDTALSSELYALSAVLMDAENGRILFEKNGTQILPMASTTKIMTCILALESVSMDDYVSVSAYAAGMPKVHLGAGKGQVFQLRDLMYSLMLESHNDSAVVIAEHVGNRLLGTGKRSADNTPEESRKSVLAFAELMNARAEEIGCKNTFFVTPNGLDGTLTFTDRDGNSREYQHSTTAEDLAAIMRYCIAVSPEKEEFLKITQTREYGFTDYIWKENGEWQKGGQYYSCINHNVFLDMMSGVLTGKTGFTGKAGYCYVGALQQGDKMFAIALLACGWPNHKTWKWHDAKILYEYGLNNYERKDVFAAPELKKVSVCNGVEDSVLLQLVPEEISLLLTDSDQLHTETEYEQVLEAPVEPGEIIGWQNYYVNGELYTQLPVRTAEAVEKITYLHCLEQIIKDYMMIKRYK